MAPGRKMQAQAPHQPERVVPPQAPIANTLDRRLFTLIDRLPHTPWSDRYVEILSDLGQGPGWVAASLALAWLGGSRGRKAGLACTVAALGTTYIVQRELKPAFRRRRPYVGREIRVIGLQTSDASFPSGHTASSFAAATALSAFYPKVSPLLYTLAAAVGLSRVYLRHHFPSDAAVGSLLGVAAGTACAGLVNLPSRLRPASPKS